MHSLKPQIWLLLLLLFLLVSVFAILEFISINFSFLKYWFPFKFLTNYLNCKILLTNILLPLCLWREINSSSFNFTNGNKWRKTTTFKLTFRYFLCMRNVSKVWCFFSEQFHTQTHYKESNFYGTRKHLTSAVAVLP